MKLNLHVLAALASLTLATHAGAAEKLRAAVFDLELEDTSLQGELAGPQPTELERLAMTSARLREALERSERFEVVDIAPVAEQAKAQNLQACGQCDIRMAREIGADLAVTGTVQKVSNLILNINLYVRDAHTGELVGAASADIRGNTDESWRRGLDWLLKNRILDEAASQ
jgi:Protein of unknown function (DUF2380)